MADEEKDQEKKKKRKLGHYEWRGTESLYLSVRDGTDPDTGKPNRYTKTVLGIKEGDERAADTELALFIAEIKKGKAKKKASKETLRAFSVRWMRDYVKTQLSRGTAKVYQTNLDNYILPTLGDLAMSKIKQKHLLKFYNNLQEDGIRKDKKSGPLGPATIQKCHHIISSMFSTANDWGEIDDNPCEKVKPPKVPKRRKVSLDKAKAKEMLQALAKESLKYRVLTVLSASTGMRRGELLGIGNSTLDLDNCLINIDRASTHVSGEGIFIDDPKTEASIRTIPFPQSIVPLLKEMIAARDKQRNKCGELWQKKIMVYGKWVDNDLLFTQWNGKPMHPNSVDTWFTKFKEENKLPDNLTFHGLRHTNVYLLLKHGTDLGTVADLEGHARKTTTLDYDDPSPEAMREASDKINDVLSLPETIPNLIGKPVNIRRKREKKSSKEPEK
ncbi:MAG: site-specific integrase [Syntrophomonadaceae bacterium]|nr:site-specific integrase [Syntrophomonadaceae bacterium]